VTGLLWDVDFRVGGFWRRKARGAKGMVSFFVFLYGLEVIVLELQLHSR
jgi:hypothetical protein